MLKKDNDQVRGLITDAVKILCKTSIKYRRKFTIEGLLGITIDDKEVVLVNIREDIGCVDQPLPRHGHHQSEHHHRHAQSITPSSQLHPGEHPLRQSPHPGASSTHQPFQSLASPSPEDNSPLEASSSHLESSYTEPSPTKAPQQHLQISSVISENNELNEAELNTGHKSSSANEHGPLSAEERNVYSITENSLAAIENIKIQDNGDGEMSPDCHLKIVAGSVRQSVNNESDNFSSHPNDGGALSDDVLPPMHISDITEDSADHSVSSTNCNYLPTVVLEEEGRDSGENNSMDNFFSQSDHPHLKQEKLYDPVEFDEKSYDPKYDDSSFSASSMSGMIGSDEHAYYAGKFPPWTSSLQSSDGSSVKTGSKRQASTPPGGQPPTKGLGSSKKVSVNKVFGFYLQSISFTY